MQQIHYVTSLSNGNALPEGTQGYVCWPHVMWQAIPNDGTINGIVISVSCPRAWDNELTSDTYNNTIYIAP